MELAHEPGLSAGGVILMENALGNGLVQSPHGLSHCRSGGFSFAIPDSIQRLAHKGTGCGANVAIPQSTPLGGAG